MFTGNEELQVNERALRTFRSRDVEKLTPRPTIIPTGTLLTRPDPSRWDILLSRGHYARELPKVDVAQFAQRGKIAHPQKLRAALRQVMGSLIWLRQTRPDIGYDIAKIATDSFAAYTDVDMALSTLLMYSRTVRFIKDFGRGFSMVRVAHPRTLLSTVGGDSR